MRSPADAGCSESLRDLESVCPAGAGGRMVSHMNSEQGSSSSSTWLSAQDGAMGNGRSLSSSEAQCAGRRDEQSQTSGDEIPHGHSCPVNSGVYRTRSSEGLRSPSPSGRLLPFANTLPYPYPPLLPV